ncbi:carbohydrate ABC transporter permease [Dictyobacter aurantiacus]|uniref:Sugar ABC transporter permease n=1 Tax=Dictyobacter aurantiacus TaxID=1936993 RepID=A0A401ZLX6_9CHLR|nr:sugar ABC transporter permease [Dictyobacter aurantiacus]GCE07889.1 sugar ABC transporter permease [Dictyobacter aurantiacus]
MARHHDTPGTTCALDAAKAQGRLQARRNYRKRTLIENMFGWVWLLPAAFFFSLFTMVPIVKAFTFAFQYNDLINPPRWVGWSNFMYVLADPQFWTAWKNSAFFMLYALIFGYFVPIILAIIVNEIRRGSSVFRLFFYLPAFVPPVAAAILWKWIYLPDGGLANTILEALHIVPQPFLNSTTMALPSLVIYSTWAGFGGSLLLYTAALRGVSVELYDAAEIDGASILQRIWHVTFPQIRFLMLIMLIAQILGTMQVFNEPFLFTSGGPAYATTTVVLQIYNYAFREGDFGAASALSLILFVVLAMLSMYYLYLMRASLGLVKDRPTHRYAPRV